MEESVGIIAKLMAIDWANILVIFLSALGTASIIAKMTKTKADDKIINAILKVIHTLGLTKTK